MQSEEQKLIDNLFSRLQQAQDNSSARDTGAEQRIQQHLQAQPNAPYYMSQAIIIQEAALKKLNERVTELENQLTQRPPASSGGFLSGLFGGGTRPESNSQPNSSWNTQARNNSVPQSPPASRGTGFLGGALQTAVGVAGGVVMANMLTSMFDHNHPEKIVNVINEPPLEQPNYDQNLDTFNQDAHASDFNHNGWDDNASNNDSGGLFGDSSFGDDDSFF